MILALALSPLELSAAPPGEKGLFIRSWGVHSGLPQLSVNAIAQSREGYLWLGTQNGLARFDGARFANYGLGDGLRSVFVKCLLEDRRGSMWIGTIGGGLSRMRDGRITTFSEADGLRGDTITDLAQDPEGNIWVGTLNGLYWWDGRRFNAASSIDARFGGNVMRLLVDRSGKLWVSLRNGLLLEGGVRGFVESDIPEKRWPCQALLEDASGRLWASHGNGLMTCRVNGRWLRYGLEEGVPFSRIVTLAEDSDGTVWAGSLGEGLAYFKEGRFWPMKEADQLPDSNVGSLFRDHEGNLWVGTRTGGLCRITRKSLLVFGAGAGITTDFITSVAETSDGRVWVGTAGAGLFSGTNGVFERFLGDTPEAALDLGGYTYSRSVLTTPDDSVWWSAVGSLARIKNGRAVEFYTQTNAPWAEKDEIVALADDGTGGVWLCTRNSGLKHLKDGQLTPFTDGIGKEHLSSIVRGADDTLWVGAVGSGLRRIRGREVLTLNQRNGLSSDSLLSLHLDADGTLWIGTADGGLNRWRNGHVDVFTQRQGLPDDMVSQIVEDGGFLWLGCNRGIVRVSRKELDEVASGARSVVQPLVIGRAEGMEVEECSNTGQPAAIRTRSGRLCFSTAKGLVVVDPANLVINTNPPAVLIEEILVDGIALPPAGKGNFAPAETHFLQIAPGKTQIELHYTALSFAAPEKVRFRYKLEGLDADWIEAGPRRLANYSHLPHGKYVFRVLAANNNGVWNETGASLHILVQPYFWETGWFMALALLSFTAAVSGTAWLVTRSRNLRRIQALEKINAIERERSRIARDIHDDLGAQVTKISMIAQVIEAETPPGSEMQSHIREIHATSRSLIQSMDETVWAVNPKNDTLPHLADYIYHYTEEFFRHAGLRRQLKMPDVLPAISLPADVRHNVFLVVKEALHNVMKHAAATEVRVEMSFEKNIFRIVVSDNGRGIVPAGGASSGDGLGNMKTRMEQCGGICTVKSGADQGTTVMLALKLNETSRRP